MLIGCFNVISLDEMKLFFFMDMKKLFSLSLLLAAALLASCAGNTQVGVLTKPTPATTNLPGHD